MITIIILDSYEADSYLLLHVLYNVYHVRSLKVVYVVFKYQT